MKKKLLAMTLASAMCVSMLAGCGDSSSTNSGGSSASSSDDAYNISVIVKLTDGHFNKVMAGAKAYADEHDNVNVDIQSPTSATSYDEQVNMIETSLGNPGIDALVLAPLQSDSASTLVANTDKVVIALDTDFTSDKKLAFVGTGNKDAAKSGGTAAVEAAKANGVDKPTVLIVTGVQGDETHEARLAGYKEGVEEAGGEVVEVQYCDGLAEKAATAISAIKDGALGMDVAQLGYDMGYKAVEAAVKALEGEKIDSFIDSGAKIVDSANCDEYIDDMKSKGLWE